jgi:hypothetical protein
MKWLGKTYERSINNFKMILEWWSLFVWWWLELTRLLPKKVLHDQLKWEDPNQNDVVIFKPLN